MAEPRLTTEQLDALAAAEETPAAAPASTMPPQMAPRVRNDPALNERISPTRPDTSFGLNPLELGLAGAGKGIVDFKRGLTGEPEEPTDKLLMQNAAARFGEPLAAGVGSILAKPALVPQMAYGAITGAMKPGGVSERVGNALLGAAQQGAGQLGASALIKGMNAARGVQSPRGQMASAAEGAGLKLTAGDILDNDVLRLAERGSLPSASRNQGAQVAEMMTAQQGDPLSKAIMDAYAVAQDKVAQAAAGIDAAIAANPNLNKLVPRETVNALKQINKEFPQSLNLYNKELEDKILALAGNNSGRIPKGMSFSEMDEIRRALGPVVAKMQRRAESGASDVTTDAANAWNGLYKSIIDDMNNWAAKGGAEKGIMDMHNQMKDAFKETVLPLREHRIAGKVIHGGYDRPEDILRDVTSHSNKSIVNDLEQRLLPGGQNAFQALRSAQRGAGEFVSAQKGPWAKPLTMTGIGVGATSPWWIPSVAPALAAAAPAGLTALAAEQTLVHGLNTGLGRAVVKGSPVISRNPALNSAVYAVPRQGIAGLDALNPKQR